MPQSCNQGVSDFADFVTPLKKRRMARASICAELPTFTAAPGVGGGPGAVVPESPLAMGHRSVSVSGETTGVPLLDAASLQQHAEAVDMSGRLPNGFRPPPHPHISRASAGSSADSVFEVCWLQSQGKMEKGRGKPASKMFLPVKNCYSFMCQLHQSSVCCHDKERGKN